MTDSNTFRLGLQNLNNVFLQPRDDKSSFLCSNSLEGGIDGLQPRIDMDRRQSQSLLLRLQAIETVSMPLNEAAVDGEDFVKPRRSTAPVGFWNEVLAETRKRVLVKYSQTRKSQNFNFLSDMLRSPVLTLCIFVMSVLSIYWGVLFDLKKNLHRATVAVVDFDGRLAPYNGIDPVIGPHVVSAALAHLTEPNHLGFVYHSPAAYNHDPLAVRAAVHNESLWAAIIINANASALLKTAVQHGNTSYDPLGACQIIYNQARDVESYVSSPSL